MASRSAVASVVVAVVGMWGAASTLTACASYSDDCWERLACPSDPEPPPDPCEGQPATAPGLDQCGVFVAEHGDDKSPGTKGAPVRTLQHAIRLASIGRGNGREAPTRRVYACGGAFEEAITLPSGVDLWGGRLCDGGDWSYEWSFEGPNQLTTIAPPSGIPLRVINSEDDATSTIFGVRVVAADASAIDGKSSIAMILNSGAKARVVSSEVHAGNGKDGEAGEDAPSIRAKDGVLGIDGADACTADLATGALPAVTVCDDGVESTGAYGGDGGTERGGDGASGLPEPAPNPEAEGRGGPGADSTRCKDGTDGAKGADGGRAGGAFGTGFVGVNGWIGIRGEDGKKGGVGQGGGGGGGSKSRGPMTACPAPRAQAGASGGSGGGGGCGGLGGKGGGYGGASIGIVALEGTELTVEATDVFTGNGGRGGVGGTGQPGGIGRHGGDGGKGLAGTEMWDACDGGFGGEGGRGGDGGGGLGGASIGIAYVVPNVAIRPGTIINVGHSGDGGLAGNADTDEETGKGKAGPVGHVYPFSAANEPPL